MLVREWFIVPLDGQLPRPHRRPRALAVGVPAGGRRAWPRSRCACAIELLIAVAVVQAALVASMLHNMELRTTSR